MRHRPSPRIKAKPMVSGVTQPSSHGGTPRWPESGHGDRTRAAVAGARETMDDGDDFTFAVAVPPPLLAAGGGGGGGGGGRVDPLYPVFGRPRSPPRPAPEPVTATARVPLGRLLLVDREPTAAGDGDLDSVPAEMYCPWSPGWAAAASPARCKKSGSTGSVLRWRPRLVGRSQSDGKEKFVFLSASGGASGRKGMSGGDGAVTAALGGHAWSHYAKGGGGGIGVGNCGARRRSFLPYKQDLVGLFANTTVFRRSYHPF